MSQYDRPLFVDNQSISPGWVNVFYFPEAKDTHQIGLIKVRHRPGFQKRKPVYRIHIIPKRKEETPAKVEYVSKRRIKRRLKRIQKVTESV